MAGGLTRGQLRPVETLGVLLQMQNSGLKQKVVLEGTMSVAASPFPLE